MQYPPPGAKAARTRAAILAAARELFARHGYAGASTRALAARAGVNVATLRYHFGNKEALWRAALEDEASEPAPRLPGDLLDALAAVPPERARLSLHAFLAGEEKSEKPDPSRVLPAVADVLALTLPGPERRALRRRLLTSIARVAAPDPPPRPASPRRRGRAR
ncbi:MAG TPA: helix-turn-helix domain-containing protein [Thermoanaerobaculia bacterium]|nr:helix-turn-helix domain-containing protein [Thermoanaerobaculia bacterium]